MIFPGSQTVHRWRLAMLTVCTFAFVQAAAQTPRRYGDLAEGPYKRLVIQNIMVIPGHGGPVVGPYDVIIEGNTIAAMVPFDPVTAARRGQTERPTGDRVIDGAGKYLMPGMIDLHMHLRQEPMEIEYVYYLKLAHGVTALVDGGRCTVVIPPAAYTALHTAPKSSGFQPRLPTLTTCAPFATISRAIFGALAGFSNSARL